MSKSINETPAEKESLTVDEQTEESTKEDDEVFERDHLLDLEPSLELSPIKQTIGYAV